MFLALSISKLFETLDKRFETEVIDEFRRHLEVSLSKQLKSMEENYASVSDNQFEDPSDIEGYKMHLDDLMVYSGDVQKLADELSIVALYKQFEIHTKRVVTKNFPRVNQKELFNFDLLKKALPFDLEAIPNFLAVDELRLINNAIKHEGKVDGKLAGKFAGWNEGDELLNLGTVYARLLPSVKDYVKSFVSAAYGHSGKFKP
jgi:hypothetical protein